MKEMWLGAETRRLQLRFEAQNVLHHMNAGNPVTGVTNLIFRADHQTGRLSAAGNGFGENHILIALTVH